VVGAELPMSIPLIPLIPLIPQTVVEVDASNLGFLLEDDEGAGSQAGPSRMDAEHEEGSNQTQVEDTRDPADVTTTDVQKVRS